MTGARVLVVDDEVQLRRALRRSLEGHGYDVRDVEDGKSALAAFAAFKPDVVLLDLMLPDMSGVEVCTEIRRDHETPIIVLSVIGDERTKVQALDQGADDYLTKPFGADELLARIRAALRRQGASKATSSIDSGDLHLDLERRTVTLGAEELHLTPTEYVLLRYLMTNAGKVLTHPMVLREVWGPEYADDSHILRTYINQLRSKLKDNPTSPRFIRTEAGIGYRFVLSDEGLPLE